MLKIEKDYSQVFGRSIDKSASKKCTQLIAIALDKGKYSNLSTIIITSVSVQRQLILVLIP